MPNYFLDTSALAKLYHKEGGSEYMERMVTEPGSRCIISPLSIVEMESALALKLRTGEINGRQVEIARRGLRADLSQRRLAVAPPIRASHLHAARLLVAKYGAAEGLRTLDAVQLAIALDLQQAGLISVFVTSDQRLCRVAMLAGCQAINPEKPGPVVV